MTGVRSMFCLGPFITFTLRVTETYETAFRGTSRKLHTQTALEVLFGSSISV